MRLISPYTVSEFLDMRLFCDHKKILHSAALDNAGGPYGENLFGGWGKDYSAADAVNWWMAEASNYDYATNTCASGKVCGHYTQVVWRNSVRLGCAKVTCNSGSIFITCNYDPRGNFNGERPY
ncbi:C-type lectin domain family 18 member A [Nymphaea thermarum]|nr:C-type lectin domain family 18 member A [Nymphaea thermarum]